MDTGLVDKYGQEIYVGDILESEYGYKVLVCHNKELGFYGSLICELDNSCRNIPYSLNDGTGYSIIVQ